MIRANWIYTILMIFFSACQEGGPCQNGGTCTRSGLGYSCKCKLFENGQLQEYPAFSGTNCETPVCKYT